MQRTSYFGCGVLTMGMTLAVGCQEAGLSMYDPAPSPSGYIEPEADTQADDPQVDALSKQAAEQARRIAEASRTTATSPPAQPPREIIWRDIAAEPKANTPIEPTHSTVSTQRVTDTAHTEVQAGSAGAAVHDPVKPEVVTTITPPPSSNGSPTTLTQSQAHQQLIKAIKHSDETNLSKAITAATIGVAGPHGELDWSLLAPLSPSDQDRVQRYHQAVSALRDQALAPDGVIDQDAVAGRLDEVFGDQPISIRSIELCEKVLGYGVYDSFPDRSFPAGRDQKIIVYVELDDFKPALSNTGEGYEVRLRQELELYESSGFEVWSHEPVQIVDVSKNQRRDFFVVQLVTLPGKLALGEYHLKVRIYDENGGTRDETSIPIQITSDGALVHRPGK